MMDKRWLDDYFHFTKKERNAVLILAFLIITVAVLPLLLPQRINQPDRAAMAQFEKEIAQLKPLLKDSFYPPVYNKPVFPPGYPSGGAANKRIPVLFHFDPNTLAAEGWRKLGLAEKTIHTIRHYLEKGGKFRKPEDIGKIYGLRNEEAERLLPYVRLPSVPQATNHRSDEEPVYERYHTHIKSAKPPYADLLIDINRTDTAALQQLPGIGSKLAARIVNFREKLGGFYTVEQVAETYGLPDSTFQKIKSHLQAASPQLTILNINTATADQLKQHPYIRWNGANSIVQYRRQHGNFKAKEDLLQIAAIPPELARKLFFYITVE